MLYCIFVIRQLGSECHAKYDGTRTVGCRSFGVAFMLHRDVNFCPFCFVKQIQNVHMKSPPLTNQSK
jgi:hypothetical protein